MLTKLLLFLRRPNFFLIFVSISIACVAGSLLSLCLPVCHIVVSPNCFQFFCVGMKYISDVVVAMLASSFGLDTRKDIPPDVDQSTQSHSSDPKKVANFTNIVRL